jgi:uncharacterized protein
MLGSRIETVELNDLATRAARRQLRVNPGDLPRLADLMVANKEPVAGTALMTDVAFDDGPEGFPRVRLTIAGEVALECQRCLQPVSWLVELETLLTVLGSDDQIGEIQEPFDSVVIGDEGLSIEAIVEDEILAALPIAVVHGPESECAKAVAEPESADEAIQTIKPFADLAAMMNEGKGEG